MNTLQDRWERIKHDLIQGPISEQEEECLRLAFFAGAASYALTQQSIMHIAPTRAAIEEMLNTLHEEVDAEADKRIVAVGSPPTHYVQTKLF